MSLNRAILLTPPGPGAIAVVRLVGPGVSAFLAAHFSRPPAVGRCVHGALRDDGKVLDDPVVVLGPGGAWTDLNLHGGPWVVRSALELARRDGFDVVEGDLPLDAIDGEDAIERETAAHLPRARTELALAALLAQPAAWAAARALPWDEVRAVARRALDDAALDNLLRLPRVAIVGPANAGKSTLANQLFAEARSITADAPGTTRDWVGEVANVDGLAVMLVDTPGLRATADAIERAAIAAATTEAEGADLVVLVLDAARPLDPDQRPLLARYPHAVRVVNKSDVPRAWREAVPDA
ncbi:MAG TPA: GTPase, partial [Tepidisphaeraceae bacterium]|nr:GTPase [Tepidisphaeraceae bacterium]